MIALFAKHIEKWSLVAHGDPFETPSSWLMPVTRDAASAVLKIYKPASDERHGTDYLRYIDGEGAVRVLEADADALLMEGAKGTRSLVHMALNGGDDAAAEILAGVVARLHAPKTRPVPPSLVPLNEQFASLFARANQHPLLTACARVARHLLQRQRDVVPLHGDLHHANVLDGEMRGWLAIDPKALIGERAYEVANLLGNPFPHGDIVHSTQRMARLAGLYAERLNLDTHRVAGYALAHAGLAASWDIDDGFDPAYRFRCAEVLVPLVEG